MGLLDLAIGTPAPVACYLIPEGPPPNAGGRTPDNSKKGKPFVFQYWPQTVEINYEPTYAEHEIPATTHPLYQWVGGKGRSVSFEAIFTSELDPGTFFLGLPPSPLTPSNRYTVDVAAALAMLQSFMMPSYEDSGSLNGTVTPPPKLQLVLPSVGLDGGASAASTSSALRAVPVRGKSVTYDAIDVLLFQAPITIESSFPDGSPRIASVRLTFREIIQKSGGGGMTITYVGSKRLKALGENYHYDGKIPSLTEPR